MTVFNSVNYGLNAPELYTPLTAYPKKFYARTDEVFATSYLLDLCSQVLSSPYLGNSQLNQEMFQNTKGFSVVFKRSGLDQVINYFPVFEPYLQKVLQTSCNAFFLNPLIIENSVGVAAHIDKSLYPYGKVITIPNLVSVLYIQVPDDLQGGELVLEVSDAQTIQIKPQLNTLIHFLGYLNHSVNPVRCSQPRISIVCEQYNLPETRLQSIPEFEIVSNNKKYNLDQS